MPIEVLSRVRDTISKFSGSHNFWNFTVGLEFGDRSCQRVMKNLQVSDPFIVDDSEWISLQFHGQSFMLHQIRKMVGLVIMVVRTRTPPALIPETFGPARINIPKAPALGLLLEQPLFESYNRKLAGHNAQITGRTASNNKVTSAVPPSESSPPRTPASAINEIDESQEDAQDFFKEPIMYNSIEEKVTNFKKEVIVKGMHDEEAKDDTYAKWLNLHDNQLGPDFE